MSLLALVLKTITKSPKVDLLLLSFPISLIFGVPALPNIQPVVPHVGALGD